MKVLAFLAIPFAVAAQYGGIVEGRIASKLTHAGAVGVKVQITGGGREYWTLTSDSGTFRIPNVVPGRYTVSLDSHDYITPRGLSPLDVAGDGPVRLDVELLPWAKIHGRVLDPEGNPIAKAQVAMMRYRGGGGSMTRTEGDGSFSIVGVGPGAYVLMARPAGPWAPTYFPNGGDRSQAQRIVVHEGDDLPNYEIRVRAVSFYQLRGAATDEQGRPFPGATLKLILDQWIGAEAETKAAADGAFEFAAVRPGDWRIQAEGTRNGIKLAGAATGTVDRHDVENLQVRLNPPFAIAGFVDRDEPRDAKGNRKVTGIFLEGLDDVLRSNVFHEQDGSFTLKAVYPGRYRIVPVGFVPGYYLDSVMLGERDVTNMEVDLFPGAPPIRINYKSQAGKVRGTVENCADARVYALPQDEAFLNEQFIRSGLCDANGRFEIDSLRPGVYYAFAFDRVDSFALSDRAFVRALASRAETFQVKQGETASVNLKVTPWPE